MRALLLLLALAAGCEDEGTAIDKGCKSDSDCADEQECVVAAGVCVGFGTPLLAVDAGRGDR